MVKSSAAVHEDDSVRGGPQHHSGQSRHFRPGPLLHKWRDLYFKAIGFKKSKTYDVSELPGAQEGYYGFWGLDPYDRDDFEFRIYNSQAEAIELGNQRALERTWPNALLTGDTANWQVGIKDARKCEGVAGQSQWAATCTIPKYYDYMFVGNIILFCPGAAVDVAQENCDELLKEMQ